VICGGESCDALFAMKVRKSAFPLDCDIKRGVRAAGEAKGSGGVCAQCGYRWILKEGFPNLFSYI